ncbi:MAG TPA: glutaredoxin domain-containing protein [Actinomycetota bacterium]|nr:glutaredoxin domain-containing protein [Actinomycetota bacterium]
MLESPIKMYSTQWCSDCVRAKRAFDKFGVAVEIIDIDRNRHAKDFVRQANGGMMSVPTIVFPDDTILTEPSASELEIKFRELGLVG